MKYEVELPDEWSQVDELVVRRDRSNGGTPTYLRATKSVGSVESSMGNEYYIIKESTLTPEILGTADSRSEAKKELIDIARDRHY